MARKTCRSRRSRAHTKHRRRTAHKFKFAVPRIRRTRRRVRRRIGGDGTNDDTKPVDIDVHEMRYADNTERPHAHGTISVDIGNNITDSITLNERPYDSRFTRFIKNVREGVNNAREGVNNVREGVNNVREGVNNFTRKFRGSIPDKSNRIVPGIPISSI